MKVEKKGKHQKKKDEKNIEDQKRKDKKTRCDHSLAAQYLVMEEVSCLEEVSQTFLRGSRSTKCCALNASAKRREE